MPSITHTQIMDDDCLFPVEATWEIEYDVTTGCPGDRDTPADADEITIGRRSLLSVCVYLEEDQGYGVNMMSQDGDRQAIVEERLRPRLDMALVQQACEDHWAEIGRYEEADVA